VRRDRESRNVDIVRVRVRVEPVGEEPDDAVAAELPRRQRDAMHDDERDCRSGRTSVMIR
jgi:hypothetical protein